MQVGKAKPAGDLATCWKTVYDMSLSAQVSARLKFMLLDLMEMRDKGTFLGLYTVRCIIVVLVMCG
jgi:hypothetical protein